TVVLPGLDGGGEWGGPAFDPETEMLYVNSNEMPWILRLVERPNTKREVTARLTYVANCANCHRQDMRGSPPEFPSLLDVGAKYKEAEIATIIREGGDRMPNFAHLGQKVVEAIAHFLATSEDTQLATPVSEQLPRSLKYTHDGYNKFLDPNGYPAVEPPWGTLNAIKLNTGEITWRIPFGEFPE